MASAKAVAVFYDESKVARTELSAIRDAYRSNSTTVLALATGAATFFGLANSPKGKFYVAALVFYALAVGIAILIFWPVTWVLNMASELEDKLLNDTTNALNEAQVQYDMGRNAQLAFCKNGARIQGPFGMAHRFAGLLAATGLVVICSGLNIVVTSGDHAPAITRVQIVDGK